MPEGNGPGCKRSKHSQGPACHGSPPNQAYTLEPLPRHLMFRHCFGPNRVSLTLGPTTASNIRCTTSALRLVHHHDLSSGLAQELRREMLVTTTVMLRRQTPPAQTPALSVRVAKAPFEGLDRVRPASPSHYEVCLRYHQVVLSRPMPITPRLPRTITMVILSNFQGQCTRKHLQRCDRHPCH